MTEMKNEKESLLVVDDTPENIDVLRGILGAEYKVRVAMNGEQALQISFSSRPPELILLDIMMPGMDGYEVCRRLKNDPRTNKTPIIFVTALTERNEEAKGLKLGAVDYITKPICPAIVRARVHTHLTLYNQQKALRRQVHEQTAQLVDERRHVVDLICRVTEESKAGTISLHAKRMSQYCYLIAKEIGLDEMDAALLRDAASLHDIGKTVVPNSSLYTQGRLGDDDRDSICQHAEFGEKVVAGESLPVTKMAREVILTHYEKWDGSGFPRGLSGENIPLVGRIAAIADVFDALTNDFFYEQKWSVDQVVSLIKSEAGKSFDPELVKVCLDLLPEAIEIWGEENV